MRILVLDGNENQAVACVRSLARAGHRVLVGADTRWSKAGWSRDCEGTFRYPAPQSDAEGFVAAVAAEAACKRGTLVLPMTEATTLPLSRHRARITSSGGQLALPPDATVVRAFDKHEMTKLAASLGIDVPRTVAVSSLDDLRELHLRYPIVLKPRSSNEYDVQNALRPTGAPVYARSIDELPDAWRRIERRCRSVLVQEYIEGAGVGYFALASDGEVLAEFSHRRLRDVRPTGSGSALRVSIPVDPRIRDAARALLAELHWLGVAMVEFRMRPDGTPVFLEVNGRFWNSLALAVYAGVDFPALLARLTEGGLPEPVISYRAGVRCRWLVGDVRHLLAVWRGRPAGFPGPFPGRLATLASFLIPVPGTYHDNFNRHDPLPELGDWLDLVCHRIPRRIGMSGKIWHAEGRPSHP